MKSNLRAAIVTTGILGILPCYAAAQDSVTPKSAGSPSSGSVQSLLQEPLRHGEAYIWYLLHCGYAVRTPTKLLIFDYVRSSRVAPDPVTEQSLARGRINPDEIKGLDVYVFVSHSHEDHYDSIIFDWRDRLDRVTYIFGWKATDNSSDYNLVGPRDSLHLNGMDIYTINCRSGVPEVAYLIKTDSLTFFFQGDYKSETMTDIGYLMDKCDTVDMAFLGAQTRRWPQAAERIVRIMERLKPKVVFPMHYGGEEQMYQVFARECAERGLSALIKCPKKPGDQFYYQR